MSTIKPKKRNIDKLKNKSITKFPAQKSTSSLITLESPLEKDFCYHLEFDNSVMSYEAQPIGYDYALEGKLRFYTPDFEIFFDTSSSYYEIKYRVDIEHDEEFEAEFSAKKDAARKLGKDLILVTDEFIAKQFRYENLCLLYKSANYPVDKHYVGYVRDQLAKGRDTVIGSLLRPETRNQDFCSIHYLIWHKYLLAELDECILSTSSCVQWRCEL
jgi:hypothetical protein